MKTVLRALAVSLILTAASILPINAQTAPETGFLTASQRIDPLRFLPSPPDSSDLRSAGDLSASARAVRCLKDNPARAYAAEAEARMDRKELIQYFSAAASLYLTEKETPETFRLLTRVLDDGRASTLTSRDRIARKNPCSRSARKQPVATVDTALYCYPSPEITDAYLLVQVLSQLQPAAIVPLMALARSYAEGRVLERLQWESDIHASVLVAAAVFTRLQSSEGYLAGLDKARTELSERIIPVPRHLSKKPDRFLDSDDMPDGSRFIPAPPEFMSEAFLADYAWYFWGKEQRKDPSRAKAAMEDYLLGDVDSMNTRFNACLPVLITPQRTPLTYRFICRTANDSKKMNTKAKYYFHRTRPFVMFGEASISPGHDDLMSKTLSYPSGHSIRGYACAYAFALLFPERTEAIMARAIGIADNRVVCGHHYKSDTEQSLPTAMAAILRLLAEPEFQHSLTEARAELQKRN